MRPIALAALLAVAFPAAAAADTPEEIRLEVGEVKPLTGFRPLCDDPSIVSIRAEGKGTVTGLKAGSTLCSISAGSPLGVRQVLRFVVVEAPAKKDGPAGGGAGGGEG